jgi:hypothetical protein
MLEHPCHGDVDVYVRLCSCAAAADAQAAARLQSEAARPSTARRRATAEDGLLRGNATGAMSFLALHRRNVRCWQVKVAWLGRDHLMLPIVTFAARCPAVTSRGKMEACPRSPSKHEPPEGVAGVLLGPPQGQIQVPAGQLAFQRSDSSSSWCTESWRPDKDELFAAKDALWRHPAAAGKKPLAVATRVSAAGGSTSAGIAPKPPRSGSSTAAGAGGAASRRTSSDRRSSEHPRVGISSAGSAVGTSVAGSAAGSAASSPYGSPFAHASQQLAEHAFSPAPASSAAGGPSAATAAGSSAADASANGHGSRGAASLTRTAVPPQQDQRRSFDDGCRTPNQQQHHHLQQGCSCTPAAGSLHVQLQAVEQDQLSAAAADSADVNATAVTSSPIRVPEVVGDVPGAMLHVGAGSLSNSTATAAALNRVSHDV